ncbi:hypothetical protein [Acinetobacter shaoyimingii]|uniref:Uncharacterized protein n=1 Tax=Acinetobacter shaoyimingii TaxID=2715164 RepID=A0A6G8RVI1_9GAMM|nr:hypothetical protein [Acinetobacter shaoyimingii]QIO05887.1 hypothetical protein G8E00_07955 [Acinetobacter shaoyimingii]
MRFLLIISLLVGCEKSEIERGISLQQLEHRVSKNEAEYIKEMEDIFTIYNLSLYDINTVGVLRFIIL